MGLISNGTTIFDAGSMASGFGGSMTFIKKLTASSSGTLTFVNGASSVVLDSTYKEYLFVFKDIHSSSDDTELEMNGSVDTGSNYNVAKTTTYFEAYHNEGDGTTGVSYSTPRDEAQTTGTATLQSEYGTDNDQCGVGFMYLFNPSSTTFVKHFMYLGNQYHQANFSQSAHVGGYFNTTSAVDAVQFKMASGNIDAGTITLYGIS